MAEWSWTFQSLYKSMSGELMSVKHFADSFSLNSFEILKQVTLPYCGKSI